MADTASSSAVIAAMFLLGCVPEATDWLLAAAAEAALHHEHAVYPCWTMLPIFLENNFLGKCFDHVFCLGHVLLLCHPGLYLGPDSLSQIAYH